MENKNKISVILPIKSSKVKDFDEYFDKCILSVKNQISKIDELVIVHTNEDSLVKKLDDYDFGDITLKKIVWDSEPNFCSQVNQGILEANSEWISILEFDDEYSNIWFKNVRKFIEAYPDSEGFMPVVVDVDEKGMFVGFTNEATFAANFAQEMGILTNDMLHDYQNFQTSGSVLKKEKVIEFGMFKPNMKLVFPYEFLLRMTYHSMKIMSIPKIGYKHMNLREGSIFWNYKYGENPLSENEVKFWIDTAKKEYFFNNERDIKYEPQTF
jgi:glycosyltransferase involved in cell wall biosynthesis